MYHDFFDKPPGMYVLLTLVSLLCPRVSRVGREGRGSVGRMRLPSDMARRRGCSPPNCNLSHPARALSSPGHAREPSFSAHQRCSKGGERSGRGAQVNNRGLLVMTLPLFSRLLCGISRHCLLLPSFCPRLHQPTYHRHRNERRQNQ
jgi:hypothetical protein